ncbi:MAG: gamma-glutamylcyclotransferase family protein [Snowella sp.]|nr:gamma-glutamylcyclotransferase family protein [Snowella sp.]
MLPVSPVWSQTIEPMPPSCRPAIAPEQKQYIVGYGSLMEDESRHRTAPQSGEAYPILLKGYRRGWFIAGPKIGFGASFLGVQPDSNQKINAVIYEVLDPTEVAATDRREGSYCRALVPLNSLKLLKSDLPQPDGQIWIYTLNPSQSKVTPPSPQFPIVQSYVDIFLSGCLEQAERFNLPDFPQQCIETTTGWSSDWVNDRLYPRRPFLYQPKAGQIDRLLEQLLPQYFRQIKIE